MAEVQVRPRPTKAAKRCRQWWACTRKVRYATEAAAKTMLTRGDGMESYQCRYCEGFHNGHPPRRLSW